jgi:hypothetical protein
VKRFQHLAGEAADARAARPTGSPPPVKSRRLRFLPPGRCGRTQRYEDRINVDVVEGGVEAVEQPFPDHMHTSTAPGEAVAASSPPVPENATKEEAIVMVWESGKGRQRRNAGVFDAVAVLTGCCPEQ